MIVGDFDLDLTVVPVFDTMQYFVPKVTPPLIKCSSLRMTLISIAKKRNLKFNILKAISF